MTASSAARRFVLDTISSANDFSPPVKINNGRFNFMVRATTPGVATITVQRTIDSQDIVDAGTATWIIAEQWVSPTDFSPDNTLVMNGTENTSDANYRWGIRAGDYTSGVYVGEIRQ